MTAMSGVERKLKPAGSTCCPGRPQVRAGTRRDGYRHRLHCPWVRSLRSIGSCRLARKASWNPEALSHGGIIEPGVVEVQPGLVQALAGEPPVGVECT